MSNFLGWTSLLAATIWQFIDFPTDRQNILQKQATFMRIVGFPGVVGVFDGTRVHYSNCKRGDIPIENKASVIIFDNFPQCKAFKKNTFKYENITVS